MITSDGSGGGLGNYVVTGLAILGIALGGAGLYVGLNGRGMESQQDDRLSELEQKTDRLSGGVDELQGQLRGLYNQTRSSLENVSAEMQAMRDQIAPKPPPVAAAAATPAPAAASEGNATTSGGKTYSIRSGDLLTNVAKRHGTTVEALLKANPGLNPNRLKVGQVIKIP